MKLNFKSYTVKENQEFRLRIETWEALRPKGLVSVNFIQEYLNKDGDIDPISKHSFNLTKEEINNFCKGLLEV